MSALPARILLGFCGALVAGSAILLAMPPAGIGQFDPGARGSLRITDRDGRLLRDQPVGGERSAWVGLESLPRWVPAALIAAEDRRYRLHPGVDVLALARAAAANLQSGRIVSGGSTITQQVVRLLDDPGDPRRRRTVGAKLVEIVDALRLESRYSKETILEFYLNRLAFGRGAIGVDAAARRYFGHSAAHLSPAEAAWLAVLPRAPALYSKPEWAARHEERRLAIVQALGRSAGLDARARADALRPPVVRGGGDYPFEAPHLTGWLLDQLPPHLRGRAGTLRTTIDGHLQREVEGVVRTQVARLSERGARQAAVVVFDNPTGEILALVGSADFHDENGGQVNGALARRQPGSALKPFTYALAFENGFTPASLVADVPAAFPASGGPFVPRNYGGVTFGPVRCREALGSSLNIPAVDVLSRVGTDNLYALLRSVNLVPPGGSPGLYGLGLTLGVGEVRLLDLTAAYGVFPGSGRYRPPKALLEARDPRGGTLPLEPSAAPFPVLDPVAAWWILDILSDDTARYRSFGRGGVLDMPWPVASKTGTSSDWRDNWALGCTREVTVGVWVGDFGGDPMERVSGVYGAAPILREVFGLIARSRRLTRTSVPDGLSPVEVCSLSGELAGEHCPGRVSERFPAGRAPEGPCSFHGAPPAVATDASTAGVVRLPREYQGWARGKGWDVAAPAGEATRADRVTIVNPGGGDVFFVDPALPGSSQALVLEALPAEPGDRLEWTLDGKPIGTTTEAHRLVWNLKPGSHRLAVTNGRDQASVGFRVEGGR